MCPSGREGWQAGPPTKASTHCRLRSPAFLSEPRRQQQVRDAQGRGTMKEQGQLQNCSSLQSPANDFLQRSAQSPSLDTVFLPQPWVTRTKGGERRFWKREVGGGAENCPCSCHCKRECFLFDVFHRHQIRQAAQHAHEHACTCTRVSEQPTVTVTSPYHLRNWASIQRDVPSVFSPNPIHPMETPTPYASPPSSGLQTKLQL